jgi:hypothetical protein
MKKILTISGEIIYTKYRDPHKALFAPFCAKRQFFVKNQQERGNQQ